VSGATLFISDLHLDGARPEIVALFERFVDGCRGADALYILGDLFEAWVGDDDDSPLGTTVCAALHRLTQAGTPVFVMHGNRDFLLGEDFAERSGCTLLPDPVRIELYGESVLLSHGDMLCTDDTEYQRFRALVRNPDWQGQFLAKPLAERRAMAAALRQQSREATRAKAEYIMDVNQDAVLGTLHRHGVARLIHGHTHRPAVHEFEVDGKPARRIVLGDWYEQGSVLRCSDGGYELRRLPLS